MQFEYHDNISCPPAPTLLDMNDPYSNVSMLYPLTTISHFAGNSVIRLNVGVRQCLYSSELLFNNSGPKVKEPSNSGTLKRSLKVALLSENVCMYRIKHGVGCIKKGTML